MGGGYPYSAHYSNQDKYYCDMTLKKIGTNAKIHDEQNVSILYKQDLMAGIRVRQVRRVAEVHRAGWIFALLKILIFCSWGFSHGVLKNIVLQCHLSRSLRF